MGVIDNARLYREARRAVAAVLEDFAIVHGQLNVLLRIAGEKAILVGWIPIHFGIALISMREGLLGVVEIEKSAVAAGRAWEVRLGQSIRNLKCRGAQAVDARVHTHFLR